MATDVLQYVSLQPSNEVMWLSLGYLIYGVSHSEYITTAHRNESFHGLTTTSEKDINHIKLRSCRLIPQRLTLMMHSQPLLLADWTELLYIKP